MLLSADVSSALSLESAAEQSAGIFTPTRYQARIAATNGLSLRQHNEILIRPSDLF